MAKKKKRPETENPEILEPSPESVDELSGPGLITGRVALTRDPSFYERDLPFKPVPYKRIAGIDLGTNCGIAFCDFIPGQPILAAPIIMGQWLLDLGPYDTGPLRHVRLKQFLSVLQPDLIMYEDVKFSPPAELFRGKAIGVVVARVSTSAEFIGGLKTTLTTWAAEHGIPTHGLAISEIKKFATGKGVADKVKMIEAANEKFGTAFDPLTYERTGVDNIVDAAFACYYGVEAYSAGVA